MDRSGNIVDGVCKRHPTVVTRLGCSRCGEFICPKCLIQTPVGARCADCANVKKNPLVSTGGFDLTRSILAGVGTAAALWVLYVILLPIFGQMGFLIAMVAPAAIGYAVGEVVYRSSGYRRNNILAWVAGLSVVVGFGVIYAVIAILPITDSPLRVGIFGLLIGVFLAVRRVRL